MIILIFGLFIVFCTIGVLVEFSKSKNLSRACILISAIVLCALAGLREIGIDQDSIGYLLYYNLDDGRMSLAAEPTFVAFATVTRDLFGSFGFRWLLVIYAILGVAIKLYAIKKLTNLFWLSLITYFSYFYFLHEFTQIRAGVASGFVLLSLYYVYRRNLFIFILLIVIASAFHYSALVALPLYFLRKELNFPIKILISLAVPFGIVVRAIRFDLNIGLPIELISSKIEVYTALGAASDVSLNVFNALYIVKYALLYIFLIFCNSIGKRSIYFPLLIQAYALSMFFYLALSFNITFAMRISEIFGVVEIVLIPMLMYAFRRKIIGIVAIMALAVGNLSIALFESKLVQLDN